MDMPPTLDPSCFKRDDHCRSSSPRLNMSPASPSSPASPASPENSSLSGDAAPTSLDSVNDRLAEAARYAVLGRVLPGLRHDVASSMQPVRMLLMVLERRVQNPAPDLAAIIKNVMSLSALTKQAAADCMAVLGWTDSSENFRVSLRVGVDQAARLLALELSENALALVNGVADDSATAPESFFRSVFIGALLAFCDQHAAGGALEVRFEDAAADSDFGGRLQLQLLPSDAVKSPASPDGVRKPRMIGWADVQAMAMSCGVKMAQGDGWLTLDLPRP